MEFAIDLSGMVDVADWNLPQKYAAQPEFLDQDEALGQVGFVLAQRYGFVLAVLILPPNIICPTTQNGEWSRPGGGVGISSDSVEDIPRGAASLCEVQQVDVGEGKLSLEHELKLMGISPPLVSSYRHPSPYRGKGPVKIEFCRSRLNVFHQARAEHWNLGFGNRLKATGKTGEARKAFMKECLASKPAAAEATKPVAKEPAKAGKKAVAEGKKLTPQQEKMSFCSKDAKAKGLKGEARKKFMSECLRKK